jgi:hypothetical protein
MKRNHILICLIAIISFAFQSCGIGPFVTRVDPDLNPLKIQGKKIIVSNFVKSERQVSITRSADIERTLESVSVRDISFQLSQFLNKENIKAEARKSADIKDLKPDELWVHGGIYPTMIPTKGRDIPGVAFNTIWLLLPGIVLPTPFAMKFGSAYYYHYEIADAQGNILYESGLKKIYCEYKNFHVWGGIIQMDQQKENAEKVLETEIFKEVRSHFY